MLLLRASLSLALVAAAAAQTTVPTGLLADLQLTPALGVRLAPSLSWIVPPCAAAPDQQQLAYRVVVTAAGGGVVSDSGRVTSNESVSALYAGPALNASSVYTWTVSTWTASCASAASAPATFVTAAWAGFAPAASFITPADTSAVFAYFRTSAVLPAGPIVSAVAHLAGAVGNDRLLSAWKLYIDGAFVNLGPGRGEAPVWGGADSVFRSLPEQTLELTSALGGVGGAHTFALQTMNAGAPPTLIFQLAVQMASGAEYLLTSDATWLAWNADPHRNPGPAAGGGSSAGNGFVEYIDARNEPVGWMLAGFAPGAGWAAAVATPPTAAQLADMHPRMQPPLSVMQRLPVQAIWPVPVPPLPPAGPVACGEVAENAVLQLACPDNSPIKGIAFASFGTPTGACPTFARGACDANTSLAIVEAACVGKKACSVTASREVFGDPCYDVVKTLACSLSGCPGGPPPPPANQSAYVAQFEREFQGGLHLDVVGGVANTTVHIMCGEFLTGNVVGQTWGWQFTWTLRDGDQALEMHKYMECRYVSLVFDGPAPASFELSAWWVSYPWVESDSAFSSSNATLDAVYDLCRYTVHAAALDTYTDSNTRERTPYEADGIIAASGRLLVQRDYLFPRHSHAYVFEHPTWPVEWLSITPFLGWQDYMATGQTDLADTFEDILHTNTKIGYLDANGLLKTSGMGRHIVDWMPDGDETDETVKRGEFTASDYMSVTNMFAVAGLDRLAQMAAAAGRTANASRFAAESAALLAAMNAQMWNGSFFCDGICTDPAIGGNSRVMSHMFSLAFGLVPPANIAETWQALAGWGLEQMGDYGAFWYQMAISSSYYAPLFDGPDDGTAIVTALAKCDVYSWCSGLLADNLTMTRESWHDGTSSHGWGSSALVGVSWGIMGIHQTSPSFATFLVKSKLGPLTSASITMPSIRGFITVSATPGAVNVSVPCNTAATLCAPRSAADGGLFTPATHALLLDGVEAPAVFSGGHLCLGAPVGCGAAGAPRRLLVQPRAM